MKRLHILSNHDIDRKVDIARVDAMGNALVSLLDLLVALGIGRAKDDVLMKDTNITPRHIEGYVMPYIRRVHPPASHPILNTY